MFSAYIKNFKRNGAIITNEELMFEVPSANGFPIQRPMVKCSEDSADNFSFTMDMNSPYYDALLPLKTIIRVEYDGDVIFNGRVLSIATSTVFHTKNVTCEGFYAYTNDTYYEGKQEKFREKITISSYLDKIIANHNASIGSDKQFAKGTVDSKLEIPNKQEKYEPTSWSQTSNLLSGLTGDFGGHMRIRFQNGAPKLDWYKYYANDAGEGSRPKVEVLKNILDLSSDDEVDIIFTRIIPIGDTNNDGKTTYIDGYKYKDKNNVEHTHSGKSISVTKIRDLYKDKDLNDDFHSAEDYSNAETNYGIIYKTIQFGNADTQEKLWNETKKWIKNCFFGLASSFTVKAIDLHIIDPNGGDPKILLGECVDVTYYIKKDGSNSPVWETKKLVCKSLQFDLFNPENNSYTFGIPTDMLENNKNNSSNKRAASEQTPPKKTPPKQGDGMNLTWRGVWQMIGTLNSDPDYEGYDAAMSFYEHGELTGTVTCYDPNEVINTDGDVIDGHPEKYKNCWFTARLVGKIGPTTQSGPVAKQVAISADRGVFAYVHGAYPNAVTHWYSQRKGYHYQGGDSGISSEDRIADFIAKDASDAYGGQARADSFKAMGRLKGDVTIYDGSQDPAVKFTGEIVGKFKTANDSQTVYVAMSKEYGIFAYDYTDYPIYVKHWYTRATGLTYDNIGGFIATDNPPQVFTTDTGTPEGTPTVLIDGQAPSYPEYSKDKPYKLGDIVKHNYQQQGEKLYICVMETVGPEPFNIAHWHLYGDVPTGSTGKIFAGRDTTGTGDTWKIKLNEPILYNDEDGHQRVADGFVSASDFHIQSVPSFKTKLAVVDVLIAGKVDATEIAADLAYIRSINSDKVHASTWVSSENSTFTNVTATNITSSNYIYHYYDTGGLVTRYLEKCFYSFDITSSDGVITLTQYSADGEESESHSFNMAATQFFKDAVAAAWDNGGKTAYFTASRTGSMDPGQTSTIYAYYTNSSHQAATSEVVNDPTHNIYSSLTIGARALRIREVRDAVIPRDEDITIEPGSDHGVPYDGLGRIVVRGDSDLKASNIKSGVQIFNVTGTYAGGDLETPADVRPTISDQTITPSSGYYGLASVTVEGDPDLVAGNIKNGVQIFGVTGTYSGGTQTVTFDKSKCFATSDTEPVIDGHTYTKVKNLGALINVPQYKSIVIVFSVGSKNYYYYFEINR